MAGFQACMAHLIYTLASICARCHSPDDIITLSIVKVLHCDLSNYLPCKASSVRRYTPGFADFSLACHWATTRWDVCPHHRLSASHRVSPAVFCYSISLSRHQQACLNQFRDGNRRRTSRWSPSRSRRPSSGSVLIFAGWSKTWRDMKFRRLPSPFFQMNIPDLQLLMRWAMANPIGNTRT